MKYAESLDTGIMDGAQPYIERSFHDVAARPQNETKSPYLNCVADQLGEAMENQTASHHGDAQKEFSDALNLVDRIGPSMPIYNACKAESDWNADGTHRCCGDALLDKIWSRPQKNSQGDRAKQVAPSIAKYGGNAMNWPKVGCSARFYPWARGGRDAGGRQQMARIHCRQAPAGIG